MLRNFYIHATLSIFKDFLAMYKLWKYAGVCHNRELLRSSQASIPWLANLASLVWNFEQSVTIGWAKYEKLYFMIAKLRNKVIWLMGAWPTSTTITKTTFYVQSNKTMACRLYYSFNCFCSLAFTNIVTFLFKKNEYAKIISF